LVDPLTNGTIVVGAERPVAFVAATVVTLDLARRVRTSGDEVDVTEGGKSGPDEVSNR
jgi:hypothetical protein